MSDLNKALQKSGSSLSTIRYKVRLTIADAILLLMRRNSPVDLKSGYTFLFGNGYHVVRGDYSKLKKCSFDNCFHPFSMDFSLDDFNYPHLRSIDFDNFPNKLSCLHGTNCIYIYLYIIRYS